MKISIGDIYYFKSDNAPASLGKLWYDSRCEIKKIDFSMHPHSYRCRIVSKRGFPMYRWISADALYLYTNCPNPDMTIPKVVMKFSFLTPDPLS